jgi:AmiR/NasT family two-component response regulator
MARDHPLRGVRILVAEDNALQALDLMALLKEAGAEIIGPAKTVAEVLALAELDRY